MKKEVKTYWYRKYHGKLIICYKLKFIDSSRFMTSSLSNLVNNLAKGTHNIKYKYRDDKKNETCEIKCEVCKRCLEYKNAKDDLILHKCLCYNRNY